MQGGCFDVFAWRRNRHRFVELKRRGKDRIRETQKRWLEAARRCGIKMSGLLIVEWDTEQQLCCSADFSLPNFPKSPYAKNSMIHEERQLERARQGPSRSTSPKRALV